MHSAFVKVIMATMSGIELSNLNHVLTGGSDEDGIDSILRQIEGEGSLGQAVLLDQSLESACIIMEARLLGFRALAEECRCDHEK